MNGKEDEQGPGKKQPAEEDDPLALLKFPLRILEVPIDEFNKTAEELGLRKIPKLTDKLDQVLLSKKKRVRARKRSKKKSVSNDDGHTAQNAAEEQHQTKAVE